MNKIKHFRLWATCLFLFLTTSAAYAVFPIPRPGYLGWYSPASRMIWCSDHSSCMHEVGHKLDDQAGWVSSSQAYIYQVEIYMIVSTSSAQDGSINPDKSEPFQVFALFYDRSNPDREKLKELYATMFEKADGREENMPPAFRQFYNWPLATRWIQEYVR